MNKNGLAFIISGPSSVGKTRIIRNLIKNIPGIHKSISVTTRKIRADEIPDQDYHYLSDEEFKAALEREEFLECTDTPFGLYATPKRPVLNWLTEGYSVIFDIDPRGAIKLKQILCETYGVQICSIFLLPPSLDVMRKHLQARGSERGIHTEADIEKRLLIVKDYIEKAQDYDFVLVNHNLEDTIDSIVNIYSIEKLRSRKYYELKKWVSREMVNG